MKEASSSFFNGPSSIYQNKELSSSDSDDDTDEKIRKKKMKWMFKEKILSTLPQPWNAASNATRSQFYVEVFTLLTHYLTNGTHSAQLASLTCVRKMLAVQPTNRVPDDVKEHLGNVCHMLVPPLSSCLGDMKYSSTRDEALKVVEVIAAWLISYLSGEDIKLLRDSLMSSPLNRNSFKDYNVVLALLDKLKFDEDLAQM